MGKTSIEWTDYTFNIVWGCVKVSEECKNCYADTLASRYGYHIWGPSATTERRTFGVKYWNAPLAWNQEALRQGKRLRVFCSSMADVYEDHPTVNKERLKLWPLIEKTPMLDWLILTKRPENILKMTPQFYPHMWLGTSVGTQKRVEERLKEMECIRLAGFSGILFLSCEPLLECITLDPYLSFVNWVITGAESGAGARPMDKDWVRSLRDQCITHTVPFFYKQDVLQGQKIPLPELDGRIWNEYPTSHEENILWQPLM